MRARVYSFSGAAALALILALQAPAVSFAESPPARPAIDSVGGPLSSRSAVLFAVKLRASSAKILDSLLEAGVDARDAASVATIVQHRDCRCTVEIKVELSSGGPSRNAARIERATLHDGSKETIIERRGVELRIASELEVRTLPHLA